MKPIVMTPEIKESLIAEFSAQIDGTKMFDGEFTFKKAFKWEGGGERATVSFSPVAFMKMLTLVNGFTSEVGWHGVTYREGDGPNFLIKDIVVYPQTVTGANVDTDQEKYTKWLYEQPDEVFDHLRMQGHSHVNFSVTPSGTDLDDQKDTMRQIKADDFYIFIIWNKKMEYTIKIFDMKENTLYENADIDLKVGEADMSEFLEDAKKLVEFCTYKPTTPAKPSTVTGMAAPGVGVKGGTGKRAKKKGPTNGEHIIDDDDDDYGGMYLYGGQQYGGYDWRQRYGY